MSTVEYIMGQSAGLSSAGTSYFQAHACTGRKTQVSETSTQIRVRGTPTYSNFRTYISVNSVAATSTMRLRKNTANANSAISITASTTGEYIDSSHTDTFAATDLVSISLTTTASGTLTPIWAAFTSDTGDIRYGYLFGLVSTANQTTYWPLGGVDAVSGGTTTEAQMKTVMRTAGTLQNGWARITTNGRSLATTVRSRKNGGAGNIAVSCTGSTTGLFEDTSNTDTIASGDTLNYSITTGNGTGNFQGAIGASFIPDSGKVYPLVSGLNGGTAFSAGTTRYAYPAGELSNSNSNQANAQVTLKGTYLATNLFAYVSANASTTGNTTVAVQKAGIDTSVALSITHGSTGYFEDTTNSVQFSTGDQINYKVVAATGGTTTFTLMGCHLQYDYVPSMTGSGSPTERHDSSSGAGTAIGGSGAVTEGRDSSAGSGTEKISGSGAPTEGHDSSSASGGEKFAGTASATEQADTAAGTGTEKITGSSAAAEGHDSSAGTGAAIGGSGAPVEGHDTASGAGAVTFAGAGATSEGHDSSSGTGTAIGGSGAVTERRDTAAGSGSEHIAGAASASEGRDHSTGAAVLSITGSGSAHEGGDNAAGNGAMQNGTAGTGASVEGRDTSSASGSLVVSGSAAVAGGSDSAASSGLQVITGTAASSERHDAAQGSGALLIAGSAAIMGRNDTSSASGAEVIAASAAAIERRDNAAASGSSTLLITGAGAVIGAGDTSAGTAQLTVSGAAAVVARGDTASGRAWLIPKTGILVGYRITSTQATGFRIDRVALTGIIDARRDFSGTER